MQWHHETSLDWMDARRKYLTATEAISLLPELKKYRKALEGESHIWLSQSMKLYEKKRAKATIESCKSAADAARGHLMEEYAIEEYNRNPKRLIKQTLHHWDDRIVAIAKGRLAFSPDALTIVSPSNDNIVFEASAIPGSAIGEIKAYSMAKHIDAMLTDKMKLDERYQIAAGLAVLSESNEGSIIFYCPDALVPLFEHHYTREDLEEEINDILEVEKMFKTGVKQYKKLAADIDAPKAIYTEREIWEATMADWSITNG